jgi:hypothetical protein
MTTSRTRTAGYSLAALGALAALAAGTGTAAAAIDPSAYGIAASGPHALAAQPAVDWTAGPALSARSGAVSVGPIHVASVSVDAGDGFADSRLTGLDIAGYSVASLTASCRNGATSLAIDGNRLKPGERIALLGGGTLTVGATSTHPDTSNSIVALAITLPTPAGTEVVTFGQARCGQA